jgi:uncharacterized protein YdbL (DUF1318 family)
MMMSPLSVPRWVGALMALVLATLTVPAGAEAQDAVVEAARAQGVVGEQADGYLGFVAGAPNADLKARVDQINILRRKIYTEAAQSRGVTVDNMAAATACELFVNRVGPNQFYRNERGEWAKRNGENPVPLPSFCG